MKQIAQSFSNRAIRNAFACIVISLFALYPMIAYDEKLPYWFFAIPTIAALYWFFVGLSIRKKLKNNIHRSDSEYTNYFFMKWNKKIEFLITIIVVSIVLLNLRKIIPDNSVLFIVAIALVFFWHTYKWKEIMKMFK